MKSIQIKSTERDWAYGVGIEKFHKNYLSRMITYYGNMFFVVTDENVFENYKDYLPSEIFKNRIAILPAGEKTKSIKYLKQLYSKFLKAGLNRYSVIMILGGGVIGDLAGFAAASFMRGIAFYSIPTTLLSMVDSSIGGKTGINLSEGKNLVGAFKAPRSVFINPMFLKTLPKEEFASGMAEIIKSALIRNRNLFCKIEKFAEKINMEKLNEIFENEILLDELEEIIYRTILIKKEIVEKDEYEKYTRKLLNFGHSFGHSIEKQAKYGTYTHGEAVAYGMLIAMRLSEKKYYMKKGNIERVKKLLLKFNLTTDNAFPIDDENFKETVKKLKRNLFRDKKTVDGKIYFVFLKRIGEGTVKRLDINNFFNKLK